MPLAVQTVILTYKSAGGLVCHAHVDLSMEHSSGMCLAKWCVIHNTFHFGLFLALLHMLQCYICFVTMVLWFNNARSFCCIYVRDGILVVV